MNTGIGASLRDAPRRRAYAACVGLLAVSADVFLSARESGSDVPRFVLTVVAVTALTLIARGDPQTLGLTLRPRQGVLYWVKATARATPS